MAFDQQTVGTLLNKNASRKGIINFTLGMFRLKVKIEQDFGCLRVYSAKEKECP